MCSYIVLAFFRFVRPLAPRQTEELLAEADGELPNVLKLQDVLAEDGFFKLGLGPNNKMLFGQGLFKDRRLLEKILLQGASEFKVPKLVDLYHFVETTGEGESRKRRKIRPPTAKAMWALYMVFLCCLLC